MKNFIKSLSLPALALVIYMLVQVVVLAVVVVIRGDIMGVTSVETMSLTLLISSVVTSVILLAIKAFRLRTSFFSLGCSPSMLLVAIAAAVLGMFATDLVCEQLDFTNIFEDMFIGMSSNIYGAAAICLVGPLTEEILFRGAVMSPMLRRGVHPWIVILFSALVFGVIHANPAQIPFAFIVGVILGLIYYKTGSLVGSSICHIINNSLSVYMMYKYGDELKDISWEGMLGSSAAVYGVAAICAFLSASLLIFFCRNK